MLNQTTVKPKKDEVRFLVEETAKTQLQNLAKSYGLTLSGYSKYLLFQQLKQNNKERIMSTQHETSSH